MVSTWVHVKKSQYIAKCLLLHNGLVACSRFTDRAVVRVANQLLSSQVFNICENRVQAQTLYRSLHHLTVIATTRYLASYQIVKGQALLLQYHQVNPFMTLELSTLQRHLMKSSSPPQSAWSTLASVFSAKRFLPACASQQKVASNTYPYIVDVVPWSFPATIARQYTLCLYLALVLKL